MAGSDYVQQRDMRNTSQDGQLGGVVVAILRLASKVLALAPDDALDEPLGRHQWHELRACPLLQGRRAGVVRHHHVVPAGSGTLWERKGGGERSAREGGGRMFEASRFQSVVVFSNSSSTTWAHQRTRLIVPTQIEAGKIVWPDQSSFYHQ